MREGFKINIVIAEASPVLLAGFSNCLRKSNDIRAVITETSHKSTLSEIISKSSVDLLIINPAFGGVLNPDDLRKESINQKLKIFAIEIGRLNPQILSLYDDHLHVTDSLGTIISKIKNACEIKKENNEEKETLSSREKEIVSYVVKGLTNQEIADKLFISIHTVITHRRNIARKLEIHSATGLTIYAIVNKIVDLSEIKL